MLEYSKHDKYVDMRGAFLYASQVRSVLQGIPFEADDLLSAYIGFSHNYSYGNYFYKGCKEYDEEKACVYAVALLLSYIPYGKAGAEYAAGVLRGKPLWKSRYENAINTLTLDDDFFDEEEHAELRELFRRSESDVVELDFLGYVIIIMRAYMDCRLAGKRNYSEYVSKIYEDAYEKGLASVDLRSYLPAVPDADKPLTEKQTDFIDKVIEYGIREPAFEIPLTREQYAAVARAEARSLIAGGGLLSAEVGNILKFRWDSLVLTAEVKSVSELGADFEADGETTEIFCEEGGRRVCISFAQQGHARGECRGYYHDELTAGIAGLSKGEGFTHLLVDEIVYKPVYMYPRILLTNSEGKQMLCRGRDHKKVHTRAELIAAIDSAIPSSISLDEIRAGRGLTDEEIARGVLVLPLTVSEIGQKK